MGLGNPLLDISAVVPASFLEKYDLKPANAVLAEDKHVPIYDEMREKFEVEYLAGGATQNSIRVAQWMLGEPQATSFTGCIGKDDYGKTLRKSAESAGVEVLYQEHDTERTGTCAVLVVDHERSLCANIAACNSFATEHLDTAPVKAAMERAKIFYVASFFLTANPDAAYKLALHAHDTKGIFAMNLAAPFIVEFFTDRVDRLMPLTNVLFANETEARAYAKKEGWETEDVKEIARKVGEMGRMKDETRQRTVVFTQGPDPVWVYHEGELKEYPATPCPEGELVDVNGAGDAFVGGFLAQLALGKPIDECVRAGHWASSVIIRRAGCSFPDKCEFK